MANCHFCSSVFEQIKWGRYNVLASESWRDWWVFVTAGEWYESGVHCLSNSARKWIRVFLKMPNYCLSLMFGSFYFKMMWIFTSNTSILFAALTSLRKSLLFSTQPFLRLRPTPKHHPGSLRIDSTQPHLTPTPSSTHPHHSYMWALGLVKASQSNPLSVRVIDSH